MKIGLKYCMNILNKIIDKNTLKIDILKLNNTNQHTSKSTGKINNRLTSQITTKNK